MGTKAGRKTTTNATDVPQGYFPGFDARSRLITTTVNMGWRMAIMIVIPIIIGLKLDERFDSKPSYVLTGFFLAIGGCAYIITSVFRRVGVYITIAECHLWFKTIIFIYLVIGTQAH